MDSITGYKDRALFSLRGKWDKACIATLLAGAIIGAPIITISAAAGNQAWGNLGDLWQLIMLPLSWGLEVYALAIIRNKALNYSQLFDGFSDYWRIFGTIFLKSIYILLWTLLLIVPGIIADLRYSMTEFVLKDNPELSFNEAINESSKLMEDHKMDLFLLELSFIGWAFLCVFTLFIGYIFLSPYMDTARAHFYEDLKAEQNN